MPSLRIFLILTLSSLVLGAETDYRFAFPQSEILLGIDVKWLLKSPMAGQMKSQIPAGMSELKELKSFEGMIDLVDSAYLSVVSKAKSQSDVIILLKGKFDEEQMVALGLKNGLKVEQWGKTKVLVQANRPPAPSKKAVFTKAQFKMDMPSSHPYFALYDAKQIIVGEQGPLRVALERMDGGLTPQANPLFERARNLESANDVWIVGSTAPLNLNAKSSDPMSQMASQIRSFSLGMSVRRNLSMDLQLQTISPKAATQMLEMAKGALAMAKATAKPDEPMPIDIDKALELSASGNIVRASINLEQTEIDKIVAMNNMNKTPAAAEAAPMVKAAVIPPPPPKPAEPVRKTVMIYGLPGGPKEVPVN